MDSINAVKEVKVCGSSYVVYLTKELKMVDANPGDKVEICIKRTIENQ